MMNIARSLVLLVGLLASACGGDDEKCKDNKESGAPCSVDCECASNHCMPEDHLCSSSPEKPE
jgi:hypothetical protein